ncbi:MAG: hypothetical protein ACW981_19105 [Candidatus Hodarchaeales archaeon]|jgi:hypothetical protein
MKFHKNFLAIGLFIGFFSIFKIIPVLGQNYQVDFDIKLMEDIEIYIEVLNTILALIAVFLAFKLSRKVKGSPQETGWLLILLATIFFISLEIYGLLKGLNIFHFSGLGDVLEFFVVITFIAGFFSILKAYAD